MDVLKTLKNRIAKSKLRDKVWAAFMILSVFQVIIIGVVVYVANADIIVESEKEHLDQLINVVNEDLNSRMDAFNADALDIVIREEIKQNLNLDTDLDVGIARRAIVDFLNNKSISRPGLIDASIIDMRGNTYSVRATYYLPPDFDLRDTAVFQEAVRYNGGMVWLSRNDVNDAYAKDSILLSPLGGISGAAVIKDYATSEIKGLLIMAIKENYFSNMDYSNQKLSNVSLYLVSPDKSVVLPVNRPDQDLSDTILARVDTAVKRDSFTDDGTGDEYLVSYMQNNAMGWYLVSQSAVSELRSTFQQTVRILLITLLLSLAACFLLASGISGYITKGLKDLAAKMKRVGQGDFSAKINSPRLDEIGQLSNVFDGMVKNTNTLIKLKYEQELMAKNAEFKALQAQINPHFLHNTLDMLHWRLMEKGEEDVSRSIVALGNLLKYSIEGESIRVPLSEEIRNIEDYLFLRHENSKHLFTYAVDVAEGDGVELPKLTLQPLVENAIVHGFGGRHRGNKLVIRGYRDADQYRIEIIDNGIGMSPEQVARIKRHDYEPADAPPYRTAQCMGARRIHAWGARRTRRRE